MTEVWQVADGFEIHADLTRSFEVRSPHYDSKVRLTRRTFESVNDVFYGFLWKEIERRMYAGPEHIDILDVGGGYESVASKELAKSLGGRATVTNLDAVLLTDPGDLKGVVPVLGDATNMPIPDESQDVIYSSFLFRYLNEEKFLVAMAEFARVLKRGGVAIIQDSRIGSAFTKEGPFPPEFAQLGIQARTEGLPYPFVVLRKPIVDLTGEFGIL